MLKSNWNYPTVVWTGENRVNDLNLACENLNIQTPLLVTDKGLYNSQIILQTLKSLKDKKILVKIFSDVVGNPTGTNVKNGVDFYKKNRCDGVIAFGGGSALDVG